MTKEVKLRICGMHMHGEDGDRDDVEVISVGQMCERDGFAWITYEEVVEEEENGLDRKSTRLNSSHANESRMPSSA